MRKTKKATREGSVKKTFFFVTLDKKNRKLKIFHSDNTKSITPISSQAFTTSKYY